MDISAFRKDIAAIDQGEWVDSIPNFSGVRFKVRGLSSTAYRQTLERKGRQFPASKLDKDGNIPAAEMRKITGEALAEDVLIDWDGLEDNGVPVQYNKELATGWLTSPETTMFTDAVMHAGHVVDIRNTGKQVLAEKNSKRPSLKD